MVRCDTFTFLEPLHDVFGRGPNMGVGGAAGDDEEVGGVGNAGKIEKDDVGGFEVQGECSSALRGGERRSGRRLGHSGPFRKLMNALRRPFYRPRQEVVPFFDGHWPCQCPRWSRMSR
jgi:hypothetical protein